MKLKQRVAPKLFGSDLTRAFREKVVVAARSRRRRPDEGGLLVEVLVAMFILVIVFTSTTIALSNMGDQRVKVEQRDRALALVANFEELSRVFKCGFVVDRIDDALSDGGSGEADFRNKVEKCDFGANYGNDPALRPAQNAGDQDFDIEETINENGQKQVFTVTIRYWWEAPGSDKHSDTCDGIKLEGEDLPLILARNIHVSWKERGVEREVYVLKRDPVPADNVVFASGNRVNILVNKPLTINHASQSWSVDFHPYVSPSPAADYYITRYVDRADDSIDGQPYKCAWFPYITPDSGPSRSFEPFGWTGPDADTEVDLADVNVSIGLTGPTSIPPQGFKVVN